MKATSVMVAIDEPTISARNQLAGTVKSVEEGAVNGIVTLETADGHEIVADITMGSIERLGLKPGVRAYAIIKATEVMVGVEE